MRVLVKLFSYRNSPENPALWERSLWRSDAADYHGLEGLPWSCFVGERQWKIEAVVAMWVWGFELRFSGVVAWRREEKVKSVEKQACPLFLTRVSRKDICDQMCVGRAWGGPPLQPSSDTVYLGWCRIPQVRGSVPEAAPTSDAGPGSSQRCFSCASD